MYLGKLFQSLHSPVILGDLLFCYLYQVLGYSRQALNFQDVAHNCEHLLEVSQSMTTPVVGVPLAFLSSPEEEMQDSQLLCKPAFTAPKLLELRTCPIREMFCAYSLQLDNQGSL